MVLAGIVAARIGIASAAGAEICRYTGTTDYDGRVAVMAAVTADEGVTRVDVTLDFDARTLLWLHIHYLYEEISIWRAGVLESVGVNNRSFSGGGIVRQLWDDFQRGPEGMVGQRVQSKRLADFRRRHPGFVQHWDPATFGRPWLQDYAAAVPERRPDLDLKDAKLSPGLRSPLAMAFYWVRWLPRGGLDVPVFLTGFRADRLVDLPITATPTPGGMLWRTPLRHPSLSARPVSTATAWTSRDGHLLRLAFDVHEARGSARGQIQQQGCEGSAVVPPGWQP